MMATATRWRSVRQRDCKVSIAGAVLTVDSQGFVVNVDALTPAVAAALRAAPSFQEAAIKVAPVSTPAPTAYPNPEWLPAPVDVEPIPAPSIEPAPSPLLAEPAKADAAPQPDTAPNRRRGKNR